jgi:hypothetical protein
LIFVMLGRNQALPGAFYWFRPRAAAPLCTMPRNQCSGSGEHDYLTGNDKLVILPAL